MEGGDINYQGIFTHLSKQNGSNRIRPWESYKLYKDLNDGLIGALSQQDLDRVSTIFMAEEL